MDDELNILNISQKQLEIEEEPEESELVQQVRQRERDLKELGESLVKNEMIYNLI